MTWNDVVQLAGRVDWPQTGGVVALVLLAGLVLRLARRKNPKVQPAKLANTDQRVDYAIVLLVGAVVTGTLAQAMWGFFEHKLGISDPWLLVPLFSVLELSLLVSVRSARRMLRWTLAHDPANASAGPAGKVLAFLIVFMALVASSDSHNLGAVMFRLGMPVLALMLLLLQMWEERYRARVLAGLAGPTGLKRFLPEWVLVLLGRSELEVTGLQLVRYARRVARICRRLDYFTDRESGTDWLSRIMGWITRARVWKLRRKLARLMDHAPQGLTIELVQRRLATVYAMEQAGTRAAVTAAEQTWATDGPASHAPADPVAREPHLMAQPGQTDGPVAHGEQQPVARPVHVDGPLAPAGAAVVRVEQLPVVVEPVPASQWPAPVGPRATPDGPAAHPVAHPVRVDVPVARAAGEQHLVVGDRPELGAEFAVPVDGQLPEQLQVDGLGDVDGQQPGQSDGTGPAVTWLAATPTAAAADRGAAVRNGVNGHAPASGALLPLGRVAVLDSPASHGAGHPGQTDGPVAQVDGPVAQGGPLPVAREPHLMAQAGQADGPVAQGGSSGEPLPAVTVERAGEARAIIHAESGEWATAVSLPAPDGEQRQVVWLDGSAAGRELGADELAEFARTLYRASTLPDFDRRLSDRALAELCGVSRRWAGTRISEVTAVDVEQQPGAAIPQQPGRSGSDPA